MLKERCLRYLTEIDYLAKWVVVIQLAAIVGAWQGWLLLPQYSLFWQVLGAIGILQIVLSIGFLIKQRAEKRKVRRTLINAGWLEQEKKKRTTLVKGYGKTILAWSIGLVLVLTLLLILPNMPYRQAAWAVALQLSLSLVIDALGRQRTVFCYGCNLGPAQTARSVEGINRKQPRGVRWLGSMPIMSPKSG